jgi:hypothetical protein
MPSIATIFMLAGAALSGIILVTGVRSPLWDGLFLAGLGLFMVGILLNYLLGRSSRRPSREPRGDFSGVLTANSGRD